ncbi:MAG: hypothetical protein V3V78_03325 [Candidatus Woesearchaeota archaeon]
MLKRNKKTELGTGTAVLLTIVLVLAIFILNDYRGITGAPVYGGGNASGNQTNLTIWDTTDTVIKYENETINFYANYTNSTDELTGANCTIWFNDTSLWDNMTEISGLYEYNRSFNTSGTYDWNVSCNKTGYDTLNLTDIVVVSDVSVVVETINVKLRSSTGANITTDNLICSANATDTNGASLTYDGYWFENGSLVRSLDLEADVQENVSLSAIAVGSNDDIFIVGSLSYPAAQDDAWVGKYDSSGNHLWNVTYDPAGFGDAAGDVAVDSSGNVIVVGAIEDGGGNDKYWIRKLYPNNGSTIWNVVAPAGPPSGYGAVAVDSNDDIIVSGTDSDYVVRKYSSAGALLNDFDTGPVPTLSDVAADSNNNYYAVGSKSGDYFIMKFNSSGTNLWNLTLDNGGTESATNVENDSNDDVIVSGSSDSDIWTLKLNSSGTLLWNKTFSMTSGSINGMNMDSNDDIIVVGSNSTKGLAVKYNSYGSQEWHFEYNRSNDDDLIDIDFDSNDDPNIIGSNSSGDYRLLRYSIDGFSLAGQTAGVEVDINTLTSSETVVNSTWMCRTGSFNGSDYVDHEYSSVMTILEAPAVIVTSGGGSSVEVVQAEEVIIEEVQEADVAVTVEDEALCFSFVNTGDKVFHNVTFEIVAPALQEIPNVAHTGRLFGWGFDDLLGWSASSVVDDPRATQWTVSDPIIRDTINPGDVVDIGLGFLRPLSTNDAETLRLKVTSGDDVLYSRAIPVDLNGETFAVVIDKRDNESLFDIYFLISNTHNIDKEYTIELSMNLEADEDYVPSSSFFRGFFGSMFKSKVSSTEEVYGPYLIKAGETVMFAYQYEYVDKFVNDYELEYALYDDTELVEKRTSDFDLTDTRSLDEKNQDALQQLIADRCS